MSRGAAGPRRENICEMRNARLDDITEAIIDAAIQIHRDLGPGLLESVYEAVLARALEKRGFHVARQTVVRFEYDGLVFEEGFRTDLIVDHQVIVELKSVERLAPVHGKKLLTYLRLMNKRVGLLLNFGGNTLVEGPAPHRQRSPCLRVTAPPREPISAESIAESVPGRSN